MIRPRFFLYSAAFACVFVSFLPADELDPVVAVETAADAGSAPVAVALAPVQRFLRASHPRIAYTVQRAEGVLSSPGETQTTTVQTVSAEAYWNLGDYITLRYQPIWTFYSHDAFENNLSHVAAITWRRSFVEWNARATHRYLKASIPLLETGTQTSQESHTTSVQAQRAIGARTRIEVGLNHHLRTAENFSEFQDSSLENWLHYDFTSALSGSGGVVLGHVSVENGPNTNYRQFNARLRWQATERLRADVRAGVERRDFMDTAVDASTSPVYGGALFYQPFEHTSFVVGADQTVATSYLNNQIYRSRIWRTTLSQRLVGRLYADFSYTHRSATFSSSSDLVQTDREDEGWSYRVNLRTQLHTRGSLAVFYQRKRNDSTDPRFSLAGDIVGLELSLRY